MLCFDIVVDLDPTSPLRNIDDIKNCINLLLENNASNIITGNLAKKSPYFNMVELDENGNAHLSKAPKHLITGRQSSPKVYEMNASIYVWRRNNLLENNSLWQNNTKFYEMPAERSIDIDSEIDFKFVDFLFSK
jgi:CMP-N-acetylneuraminic acid synthetase